METSEQRGAAAGPEPPATTAGHGVEGGVARAPRGEWTGAAVQLRGVSHAYGPQRVLHDIDLEVAPGELITLLGSSGSGKSTILRIIGGLVQPLAGRISINGTDVSRLPPQRRGVGFVFQDYALFPHLSVRDNVAFPLRVRRFSRREREQRVSEALDLVQLADYADRLPAQLSGGQQQRVAVARAIVYRPSVLLMDEPLGALDLRLRQQLQSDLRDVQQALGITTIYVTHDQEEAFALSDRIALLSAGRIHQIAEPSVIYRRPVDEFAARFVGDLNYLRIQHLRPYSGGVVVSTEGGLEVMVPRHLLAPWGDVDHWTGCGIRPEKVIVVEQASATDGEGMPAEVTRVRYRGPDALVTVTLETGAAITALVDEHQLGERLAGTVRVVVPPEALMFFSD